MQQTVSATVAVDIAAPSTTSLAISRAGGVAPPMSLETLTATVQSGGLGVTPGQILFCDSPSGSCSSSQVIGTAELEQQGKRYVVVFIHLPETTSFAPSFLEHRTDRYR